MSATPPLACAQVRPRLSLYVDQELDAEERTAIAAHLGMCDGCRGLVADLDRLRSTARQLGPVTPPDHIWLELAGQLRHAHGSPSAATPPARRTGTWQWLGLAAALVVITAGAYAITTWRARAPESGGNPATTASVESIEQELKLAADHYDKAIAQLQAIVDNKDVPMDPAVAAVLQKNLPVMDRAIAESRAALSGSPGNEAARDSLFDALRRKVSVLQDTVALMNEMRKGNQAGAADIAAGLGRKKS